jgi:hypothetical protein
MMNIFYKVRCLVHTPRWWSNFDPKPHPDIGEFLRTKYPATQGRAALPSSWLVLARSGSLSASGQGTMFQNQFAQLNVMVGAEFETWNLRGYKPFHDMFWKDGLDFWAPGCFKNRWWILVVGAVRLWMFRMHGVFENLQKMVLKDFIWNRW